MARGHFLRPLLEAPDRQFCLRGDASTDAIARTVERAFDSQSRRRGLLGRDALGPDTAVIIAPSNAIHTFGMRFPIDVLFVSRSGKVVKRVTALRRRRIAGALRAFAAIEFCANHPGVAATRVGDTLRLEPQSPERP